MYYIFRLLRMYLKVRRTLFKGDLPHWLRDLLGLVKYVNFMEPTITIAAIALSPHHFFNRLPQYISRKNSWFGSPVKFFTQGVALMAAFSFFIGGILQQVLPANLLEQNFTSSRVYWTVLLYALLAPVCVPVISLVMAPFAFLSTFVRWPFSKKRVTVNSVIQDGLNLFQLMLIPALPSTYVKINWSRLLWSLCYYDIYFYLSAVIFFTPLTILVFLMIESILSQDYYTATKIFHLTYVGLIYVSPIYLLIVAPYVVMLQSTLTSPTRVMIAMEYSDLRVTLRELADILPKKAGSGDEILGSFDSLIAAYERHEAREIKRSALMSDKVRKLYLGERTEVLTKMLNTAQLRSLRSSLEPRYKENLVRLLDRIDAIPFLGQLGKR